MMKIFISLYLYVLRVFNKRKYTKDYIRVFTSEFFDKNYYYQKFPEIKDKNIDVIEHYLNVGWKQNVNPSKNFDANAYLQEYPDVKNANINPLLHYLKFGKYEGRLFFKEDVILVNFLSFERNGTETKISFCSSEKNIQLSLNQQAYNPCEFSSQEEIAFNKFLNKQGKHLLVFKIENEQQIKSFLLKKEERKLLIIIKNYYNFRNLFFWIQKNKIEKLSKYKYLLRCMLSKDISLTHKITGIKNILAKKEYFLFYESRDNANDNAFELFKKSLSYTDKAYFVTSEKARDSITDKRLKEHILIANSSMHLNKFLKAQAIISSYAFFNLSHKNLNALILPFTKAKLFFVPHGISCDKDSFYLNYRNLGQPDQLFCCSNYERTYFSNYCGINHIKILGYPRMDKWANAEPNPNNIAIFFTWRTKHSEKFVSAIIELFKEISLKYPEKKIYFLFHPSYTEEQKHVILNKIKSLSLSIRFIESFQYEEFKQALKNASHLITDYSSVAYDFMYAENKSVIYYAPIANIEPEYNLLEIWHEITLSNKANSIQDVLKLLSEFSQTEEIQNRRLRFFKYIDNNNTNRVFSHIEEECGNPFEKYKQKFLKHSTLFNAECYLKQCPDAKSIKEPFEHYINIGWKKGYDPSENFSTNTYLDYYQDVKDSQINPLLHYELYGQKEHRFIFPANLKPKIWNTENPFKKNILLVTHILNYTGAPILLLQIAKLLKKCNYNVFILSPSDGLLRNEFIKNDINVIVDPITFFSDKNIIIYKNLNCHFCICNTSLNAKIFLRLRKFIPSILWIHENIEPENSQFLKEIIFDSQNVYVPSKRTLSYALRYNKQPKILSYPIKDVVKNISLTNKSAKLAIAVIGTIQPRKGQDVFLDAIRMLPENIRNKADFIVLGETSSADFMNILNSKSRGIKEIKFVEAITNLDKYHNFIDNIDVLCCPSREDPFPLVVIDALMHGKAILISDHVGQTDILKDTWCGHIFESENSKQLSNLLEKIITNGVSVEQRTSARQLFLDNFGNDQYLKTLETTIEQTCQSWS